MSERLCSLGLDVGTTTTQLVLSELTVENQAGAFAAPDMQITDRKILYKSPVYFTPLLDESHVDGTAIAALVEREYENAGICRQQVHTGAIIITGESSRKENARVVLQELSGFAGDFVVATAGPDLESILAAKGAGAVAYSERTGKTVLHMDIGGGTSNLALIKEGKIIATGCMNVGGRLIKRSKTGVITYVSPVLRGLTQLQPGDYPAQGQIEAIAAILTQGLEMAAGLRPETELMDRLMTREVARSWQIPNPDVISFSGGIADCIHENKAPLSFGDMGPELGKAIRESRLCQGVYVLGRETIRATVIGAGSHSTQLSGSTVYYQGVQLPLKNLPVAKLDEKEQLDPDRIRMRVKQKDAAAVVLAIPGFSGCGYGQVRKLAQAVYTALADAPVYICLEQDMAKALGQALCLLRRKNAPCLCIDRLHLEEDSFLDIGMPIGPALPVVIKTLVFDGHQS